MGYSTSHKGFWCYNPSIACIFITRHAQFDEAHFPFSRSDAENNVSILEISTFLEVAPPVPITQPSSHVPPSQSIRNSPCTLCLDTTYDPKPSVIEPSAPPINPPMQQQQPALPSLSLHSMMTRARAGIFKPRYLVVTATTLLSALSASFEPHDFKSAAKSLERLVAMQEEIDALRSNQT